MKANEYILEKQHLWAQSRGLTLIGSAGMRGVKNYTQTLDENLLEPLTDKACTSFSQGSGNETQSTPEHTAKMQALHSSSALSVNVFQYWQRVEQFDMIASACGFCSQNTCPSENLIFEKKFPIHGVPRIPPHMDAAFQNKEGSQYDWFAVECKFSEAYSPWKHGGLHPAYLQLTDQWKSLPILQKFAQTISPDDGEFVHLHVAQLIKHILGLSDACGKTGFKLLYLWYDVPGEEGRLHRQEVEQFTTLTEDDDVAFHTMTYQDLIRSLDRICNPEHKEYIAYLKERYL